MSDRYLYQNRDWLYDQYIIQNKNATEIGKEFNLSISGIRNYIKKYNLKKAYQQKMEARNRQTKKTMIEKYGEPHALAISEFKDKKKKTMGEVHGVTNAMHSSLLKEKRKKTIQDKYNVDSVLQNESIREKYENTCLERYGFKIPTKNSEIVDKIKDTVKKKYEVSWISQSPEIKEKILSSKISNGYIHQIENQSLYAFAESNDLGYTTLLNWRKLNPNSNIEEFLESYSKNISSLEQHTAKLLNLDFYNRMFDIKNYPDLKYRPDFKLSDRIALNVDGLYWHSEINISDKKYHFKMREAYEDRGLRLLQFYSDEIYNKSEIVSSMVNHLLGKTNYQIYARKTRIAEVDQKEADLFYKSTHLMGSFNAKHIGLIYKDQIVCLLSYKAKNDVLIIERFSSQLNTKVVGGFGKILSNLDKKINAKTIHYWVDLRYGTGDFLASFGFQKSHDSLGWRWADRTKTYNRLRCRANMDQRFLSESEYAKELGWYKIYDAGQRLWIRKRPD